MDSSAPSDAGVEPLADANGSAADVTPPSIDAAVSVDATPDVAPPIDGAMAVVDATLVADLGVDSGSPLDAASISDLGADSGPVDAALPPPPPTFAEAVAAILAARGVPQITARFDEAEVRAQAEEYGGSVDFAEALDAALQSYLEDGSDQESPVALLEFAAGPPCDVGTPTDRVRCFLDDPTSQLGLVGAEGFPPENGEPIAENWVITVDIPRLSDHLHWAIVHRDGAVPAYNYGFN